jgi:DNA-binding transcriptional MerR regulator
MAYTVKEVAEIAKVSVRALHHYDEIGLLKPAGHSAAGYRLYDESNLERLQQVLFFKELGFDLKEIQRILSDPKFNRKRALVRHRKLLLERQERVAQLIASVDRTLEAIERKQPMSAKMFEGFDAARYEEEARQTWGGTPEWDENARRWKKYTDRDWDAIKKEGGEIVENLAALMNRAPDNPEVQKWIGRHHGQINDRIYACGPETYRGLADAYVQDPRFKAFYDTVKPGLAQFIRDAMKVYADTLDAKP